MSRIHQKTTWKQKTVPDIFLKQCKSVPPSQTEGVPLPCRLHALHISSCLWSSIWAPLAEITSAVHCYQVCHLYDLPKAGGAGHRATEQGNKYKSPCVAEALINLWKLVNA